MTQPDLSLASELNAAFAWWRAAGMDCDFSDDVTVWLADAPVAGAHTDKAAASDPTRKQPSARPDQQPKAAPAPLASAQPATPLASLRKNLLGDSPPGDLAAFKAWWMDAPGLDTARLHPRIAPRGTVGAALMVLVPQPEDHDRDRLLDGPHGRLLANIIAAMGLDEAQVYLASALPCHTPMADLAAWAKSGLDAVLAHHVMLVQPRRLLAFGTGLAAYLDPVNDEFLRESNQAIVNTPVMVSETLDAMMDMPRLKARFWKRWIEWSASL